MTDPGFLLALAAQLLAAGVAYGAIRSDLKNLRERVKEKGRDLAKLEERFEGAMSQALNRRAGDPAPLPTFAVPADIEPGSSARSLARFVR